MVFSPNNQYLATGSNCIVNLIDIQSKSISYKFDNIHVCNIHIYIYTYYCIYQKINLNF